VLTHKLVEDAVRASNEKMTVRLDAMDKAMELFRESITRVPTDTDKQIVQLKSLVYETFRTHDEKFRAIEIRFGERDLRFEQAARADKEAVAAAFAAAREAVAEQNRSAALAVAKSETAVAKQMDQLSVLLAKSTEALESKISDIKDRITGIENRAVGQVDTREDQRSGQVQWVGIIGGVVGLAALAVALSR
jgi:hypothetical protein